MSDNQTSPIHSHRGPAVSVVMPAYNHERFVGEAVESVLGQSFDDLELVVVDDGSTDRTAEIVNSYTDPRVRYYHQQNQDAYNALNRGIGLAHGRFISIINSDDVYAPERLARLVAVHDGTAAECIFSDVTPITDTSEVIDDPQHGWNQWHRANREYYFRTWDLYDGFLHGNFMVTTSNLFLTTALARQVGDFAPLRYLHDYDYIFRVLLARQDRTVYLHDEKLLFYRIHGGNTLSEAAIIGREQDKSVIRRYLLAKCPEALHTYLNTGIDRLVALENELHEVKQQLHAAAPAPVPSPAAPPSLQRRALEKLKRLVRAT